MKTIKGPALFLAQFAGDEPPFDSLDRITRWAADCGYVGVQIPSWDARLIDLDKAATSQTYCDDWKGQAADNGIEVTLAILWTADPSLHGEERPGHWTIAIEGTGPR